MFKDKKLVILKFSKKYFKFLFLFGLIFRLTLSFSNGNGDMEHFKAWAVLSNKEGLIKMYGESDENMIKYSKSNKISLFKTFNNTRKKTKFDAYNYKRDYYVIMYPPISLYFTFISGKYYYYYFQNFKNSNWFNFFINLPMIFLSSFFFIFLFKFLKKEKNKYTYILPLIFWMNPITLLDSPIQGYNNILFILILFIFLINLRNNKIMIGSILAAILIFTKPQGIICLPILFYYLFFNGNRRYIIKSIIYFLLTILLILLPAIVNGYLLSNILGSFSAILFLENWSNIVLSARSWNFWWIFSSILEKNPTYSVNNFIEKYHFNVKLLAHLLFILHILISFFYFHKFKNKNINLIFLLFISIAFGYNMFELNVQYNQFYIFIPFMILFLFENILFFKFTISIWTLYFLQLFVYGGIGNDLNTPYGYFSNLGISRYFNYTTLIFASTLIILWYFYFKQVFKLCTIQKN